jgi:predicted HicB family RNase H-like nuclease
MSYYNTLKYKGYHGSVEYSAEDRCLHGKILGVRSCIIYEGKDVDSIERDFRESVDEYLNYCKQKGIMPEKEYTGSFQVRIPSEVHKELATKAEASGKKMNTVVAEALESYIANSRPPESK